MIDARGAGVTVDVPPNLDPTRRSARVTPRRRRRPTVLAGRAPGCSSTSPGSILAAEAAGVAARVHRAGRRVRQGPRAVRPPDRHVPGGQAPLRQHARGHRAGDRRGVGRGPGRRRRRRPVLATPRRWPRPLAVPAADLLRQPQHPGARRHRLHLGARRPPLPAPGHGASRRSSTPRRPRSTSTDLTRGGVRRDALASTCRPRPRPIRDDGPGVRRADQRTSTRDAQRDALIDVGLRDAALAAAVGPGRRRRRAAGDRAGVRRGRHQAPGLRHHRLGHPHPDPARHRRPGRPLGAARRSTRTSSGASCSASPTPGPTPPASRPRRTRVDGGWLVNGQKVWTSGAHVAELRPRHGAHQPRRAQAPGHHHDGDRHARRRASRSGRCKMPTGGLRVQRGVLQRRVRPRRRRGRSGRRRLDRGPGHARQREREHRRRPAAAWRMPGDALIAPLDAHPERLAGGAGRVGRYIAAHQAMGC